MIRHATPENWREVIAAAEWGDTVMLGPGTYAGPIVLVAEGVTLSSSDPVIIQGQDDPTKP